MKNREIFNNRNAKFAKMSGFERKILKLRTAHNWRVSHSDPHAPTFQRHCCFGDAKLMSSRLMRPAVVATEVWHTGVAQVALPSAPNFWGDRRVSIEEAERNARLVVRTTSADGKRSRTCYFR